MKRLALPVGLLVVALAAVVFLEFSRGASRSRFPAPEFALQSLDGRTLHLSDYRGKIVFLNLWATWCPPCREEMPSMERLHRRFEPQGLVMLAVSEDSDVTQVRPFVNEMKLTFPILLDPQGRLGPKLGVTGYPETFVIDRNGQVIHHFIGPEDWDSRQSLDYFGSLLAGQEPAA